MSICVRLKKFVMAHLRGNRKFEKNEQGEQAGPHLGHAWCGERRRPDYHRAFAGI